MSTGARSSPPELPGFAYKTWLGGGGFADVFLYEQLSLQRPVAIKVLRSSSLDLDDLQAFKNEANRMARVSHPFIVSIFDADVALDGRPFLVMKHYPKPNYGQRFRAEPGGLPVPDVLRLGVQIAAAVETAHRAGILHRDIKPDNILVSDMDEPGLTDFGIAGDREGTGIAEAQAVTLAFAPPEVLRDDSVFGDVVGDVYSLGATIYSLLAGRAPFEVRGGTDQDTIQRTLHSPVPSIGRSDVPRSLELLLAQTMAKDGRHRPQSAESLARALQGIERELRLSPTELAVRSSAASSSLPLPLKDEDEAERTKAGRFQRVSQDPPATQETSAVGERASASSPTPVGPTVARPSRVIPDGASASAASIGGAGSGDEQPVTSAPRRFPLVLVAAAAVTTVLVGGGIVLGAAGGVSSPSSDTTTTAGESELVVEAVPATPVAVEVRREGGDVIVTWTEGPGAEADTFVVTRTDRPDEQLAARRFEAPPADIGAVPAEERPCFTVAGASVGLQQSPPSAEACAP